MLVEIHFLLDLLLLRPGQVHTTGELRAIVGAYRTPLAAEARSLIQNTYHVGTTDAVIERDVDAIVAEVVGDGQAFEPTPVGQASLTKSMLQTALGPPAGNSA